MFDAGLWRIPLPIAMGLRGVEPVPMNIGRDLRHGMNSISINTCNISNSDIPETTDILLNQFREYLK